MESSQSFVAAIPRWNFRRAQPAVAAYIDEQISTRRGRRVAADLSSHLLASYHRYRKNVPVLREAELNAAGAAFVGEHDDPVHGWRYALPIPLPETEQREVSKVLGAIVGALEPRLRLV